MANVKITDLAAYTNPDSTDVLPIVDVGADVTKKVSIADLLKNASAGTAAAPGIAFDGDNTGIYSPGADQVALSTNGAGRLFVAANGDVSLLDNGLYLTKTGLGNGQITFDGSTYSFISNSSSAPLVLGTNSTERLRITSAGLVGIGTSSPAVLLNISSSANGTPATSGTTQTHGSFRIGSSATSGCIDFGPNGQNPWIQATDRTDLSQNYNLLLNPNGGLVGIGTQSPGGLLHLNRDDSNDAKFIIENDDGQFSIIANNNTAEYLSSEHIFCSASGAQEKARIDVSGRLGIGTQIPSERLSLLEGTALGWNDSSGNNAARIYATSGDELRFERGSTNSRSMTIDGSGRLLIGTASDSGGALLQVNGNRIRVATAKTPASASDTGTAGEICWDASYVYVCTATNTWKRAALSTW